MEAVYLHGLGSGPDSSKAALLARELAPGLVTPDLRLPSPQKQRYSAMLERAQRVADAMKPGGVILGASLGGLLALHVAERARVRGLVLFAPALDLPDHPRSRPWLTRVWRTFGAVPVRDKTAGRWRWVDSGFLDDLRMVHPAPDPRVPTLVVHGTRDHLVSIRVSRAFSQRCSVAKLVEFDDGHDLLASPHRLLAEVRAFCDQVQA